MGPGPGNVIVGLRLRTKPLSRRITKFEVVVKTPGGRSIFLARAQIRIVPHVVEERSEFRSIQLLPDVTRMGKCILLQRHHAFYMSQLTFLNRRS